MRSFLSLLNRLFDLIFLPFQNVSPLFGLLMVSVLTGILLLIIFRYTSNQGAIKKTKEQIKAYLLAVRLFQDQLSVVLEVHARLLRSTLTYMKHSLRPLAVMLIPVVLIMIQLEMRLGQHPAQPGETVLVTAILSEPDWLTQTTLELPSELSLAAPPVHIFERREITWKILTTEAGIYPLRVKVGDQEFTKQLTVANSVVRLSSKRVQGGLWDELLYPAEAAIPANAPIKSLEVKYPRRQIDLGFFRAHWLVPFFVFSLLAGLALKGVLRTEI